MPYALQQVTCFAQLNICVRNLAALDKLNIVCSDYDGCLPLGSAGCSISYHIPTQYSWKNKLNNPYRSLWESISLLQTASIWKGLSTPSLGSHHAPIVHSGHSLLLHFTWDTYHGALSRSVFKHQHLLCSPVLSIIVRNKQQTLSHGEQAMFWAQVHALWQ